MMTRIVPAAMTSHCEPKGPMKRKSDVEITLPALEGVTCFAPLWSSVDERPRSDAVPLSPGDTFTATGPSMYLFRAE